MDLVVFILIKNKDLFQHTGNREMVSAPSAEHVPGDLCHVGFLIKKKKKETYLLRYACARRAFGFLAVSVFLFL